MKNPPSNISKLPHKLSAALAVVVLTINFPVQAAEINGFEFNGYMRGGAYFAPANMPRGGYTLGGDTQKLRLGNEGDNGIELGIGKSFDVGSGMKWSVLYMPSVWNGKYGTAQGFATISGLDFAPEASFWAGQRRLRIQDIHIVDCYLMDYGDNTGAGMTGYNLGFAKLGVGVFSGGTFDNNSSSTNNAGRINIDLSEIQSNAGGTLRTLATLVNGNFQMGKSGAGLSVSHNQSDFLVRGLTNTLFIQTANGHAGLNGQFQGLGDVATGGIEHPGLSSTRIAEAFTWQTGPFGGQALLAHQVAKVEGGINNGQRTRDFTLGGRMSYATSRNFKWLVETGTTSRNVDGQMQQRLNKFTIAPTLALAEDFWSRPELRFYVTRVNWNDAAAAANSGVGGFGAGGRKSSTLSGVQMEVWW